MRITDKTIAIVTGGASGLGAATARMLAGEGARVTLFDMNVPQGMELAEAIGGAFQAVDVGDAESVAKGMAAVKQRHGGLHVLVNCAGIGPAAKTVSRGEAHDPGVFAKTIGVNLIGSFNCASPGGADHVRERSAGRQTASAASSSTPPRSRPTRGRSGRWPMPPRRAASSA